MSYTPIYPIRANIRNNSMDALTPERLSHIWDTLQEEGRTSWLFYDGLTAAKDDYIDFMCDPTVYAYAVYDHDCETLLATYFVNNFKGNVGMMHFCFFTAGQSRRYEIGIDACNFLLQSNGGISALFGLTPKPFRHAWRYALAVGFRMLGVIPEACSLAVFDKPKLVDGVATLCTPQTLLPFKTDDKEN